MRRFIACCGVLVMLVWVGPSWKAANTSAAMVSISGSGLEMTAQVPAWVYWPAGARIQSANVKQNAATGQLSGVVEVMLKSDLGSTEDIIVRDLGAVGYAVRKIMLPADSLFGAYSVLEATDAREHRRINIVLRNEPWAESARIFFVEDPKPQPAGKAA
jgi:hypothetical protein